MQTPRAALPTPILAMDAGQTGIRAEVRRTLASGEVEVVVNKEFSGVLTDRPLLPQLADVARRTLGEVHESVEVLAIGSSGLTPEMDVAELLALMSGTSITEVRLAHDSITSYLAALGDAPGVVTAAGTGVVTLAVGEQDVARVDGWGYLIGDAGSGYWIGRAALDSVMRAHDGRGRDTALLPLALAEFPDLESAYVTLQSDEYKVSRIASWAKVVSELAAEGDGVCQQISRKAGSELAHSALSGLRRVGQDTRPDPAFSMVGNVFRSSFVREAFIEAVLAAHPGAQIVSPSGVGIDGAARLAGLAAGSALGRQVRITHS